MSTRKMMKGNIAVAEAAVRAGLDFYGGYPITPQTEVLEHFSYRMAQEGRSFVQAENEIAAINMVIGASVCGRRAMTSSSGPGMALKQEGISYAARYSLPYVMLNVQRWGTGLGSLDTSQCDYWRETRGGGNGDYNTIVLAPSTVQELVDLMYESFDIAEKYRNAVLILSEAALGQMMEPCIMPDYKKAPKLPEWRFDGTGKRDHGFGSQTDMTDTVRKKREIMQKNEQRWESYMTDDAEYIFVAFGLPSRVCRDAVGKLRADGEKAGLIRPVTLWPFPVNAFKEPGSSIKGFISVESNDLGQMVEDVALTSKLIFRDRAMPVYSYASGRALPSVRKVVEHYYAAKNGKIKEVF